MAISVQNITGTSAIVHWLPASTQRCTDSSYNLMYHPTWSSHVTGYTRKNVVHEDGIPLNRTSTSLEKLLPQTSYIICVACQSARPTRDQCRIFTTLDEAEELTGGREDQAMALWLACTIILLMISVPLIWGCLRFIWPRCRKSVWEYQPYSTPTNHNITSGCWERETCLSTPGRRDDQHLRVLENPFYIDNENPERQTDGATD